jgi:hypothetical protein
MWFYKIVFYPANLIEAAFRRIPLNFLKSFAGLAALLIGVALISVVLIALIKFVILPDRKQNKER